MKKLLLAVFIGFSLFINAQQIGSSKDWKIIAIILCTRIEGTSIDNKAFFSFGPKIPITEKDYISLRGHFNWWDLPNRKFVVIPELDYVRKIATFDKEKNIVSVLFTGVGITPNAVSPKFGVSFFYLVSAEVGYNFEFNEYKHFPTEGFRYSIGFNFFI